LPDLERAERAAQAALSSFQTDVARETAQRQAAEDRIERLELDVSETAKRLAQAQEDMDAQGGLDEIEAELETAQIALEKARADAAEAGAVYRSLSNEAAAREARLDAEHAHNDAREKRAAAQARRTAAEERQVETAALITETLSCEPAELKEHLGDLDPESKLTEPDIERKLERMSREREKMGAVNLRADEEAEEQEARMNEAGLEVMVSPPGKKLGSMSLMSGGEQALTATALIFAVFLSNPAPICVLDEVDAPLDDANVDRYCNLLDAMTKSTQTRFITITHNPVTMARMDRLFGVTMAEKGVSTLVSVDLKAAERLTAAN